MKSSANRKSGNEKKKAHCSEPECKSMASSKGLCRLHYIARWKETQETKKLKAEKRLNAYVDRMARKYPSDYMNRIKEGLETEEKFNETLQSMDDVEASETENEFLEKFLRDIKGDFE